MTRFKETDKEYYCVMCKKKHQKKLDNNYHYSFRLPDEVLQALGDSPYKEERKSGR